VTRQLIINTHLQLNHQLAAQAPEAKGDIRNTQAALVLWVFIPPAGLGGTTNRVGMLTRQLTC